MARTDRSVAGDFQPVCASAQVRMWAFFSWATGRAPQNSHRSLSRAVAASRCSRLMVRLATPRSQYWRYSEQTPATSQSPAACGGAASSPSATSRTRARANRAFSLFSLPRMRAPSSSSKGTRLLVPVSV